MKKKGGQKNNRFLYGLIACELGLIVILSTLIGLVISGNAPWQHHTTKILNVVATSISDGVVNADSHFLVTTEHGSIEGLREVAYLEPAIDYEIIEKSAGSEYEIVPTSELADNTVFNVDAVSNEVIAYKWAFQTKKELSVSKIYPANGANYVSENSYIEFSFSYPDVEGVESHFSISPAVNGSLEKHGRLWRFTPETSLSSNTTYEITIKAGLTYGEETMTKDFYSSFSTYAYSAVSSDEVNKGITLDGVSTFTESEAPIIDFGYDSNAFDNAATVDIEKISTADDYIKYLKGEQITGETIGNFAFEKRANDYGSRTVTLNQTLSTGYYIFHFKTTTGQNIYTANVEVNNLAAYAMESERDAIIWVAEDGELKSGVKVNFKNHDYTTGDNGLLEIKNISDYSNKLDYLKIGNDDKPLVIALTNFKNDLYPSGFIYTDRLLYKPTDTIKVWGYIPLQFFKDAPKRDNFSVVLFDDIKKTITVDSDGFFTTEIPLDNYKDRGGLISLQYDNTDLAWRHISVENYTLENYTYELVIDKNYILAGDRLKFTVNVKHVTGFPAANKDIVVTYDEHDYYASTDNSGKAAFDLPTTYEEATSKDASNYRWKNLIVKSGGAEYNKYSAETTIWVLKNNLAISMDKDSEKGQISFTAKTLDLNRKVKTTSDFQNLIQSNFNGSATITLYEQRVERHIEQYAYNFYTKESYPVYSSTSSTRVIGEVPVTFEDGQVTYEYPTDFKDPEANVRYSYYAILSTSDANGRPAYSYQNTYYSNEYLGEETTRTYYGNAIESSGYHPQGLSWGYSLYKFGLKDINNLSSEESMTYQPYRYSIGDHLSLSLYDYTGETVKNNGAILAIAYQESIIKSQIFTDNALDLEFNQDMYPGAEIGGAYFMDGKFYRISPSFRDYESTDSELTVSIETGKSSYEPGDTVKAKIIVTRKDGSRANGLVNLSVVNEAIFNYSEDDTSILADIYTNKYLKSYSMSTYRDYELTGGGGRGAAGGWRADFGDTLFFGSKKLSNGEAEFEFKLNDSITSFRLTAFAVENGTVINAGVGTANVVSTLPLSISSVVPKKVKNTDDLVVNAASIVSSGDAVEYTFSIKETGETLTATGLPGQTVTVNFGKQALGEYTITISGRDSAGNEDGMIYPVEIIETAQEVAVKKTVELTNDSNITPSKNPITVEIYDSGTKQYLSYLNFLEANRTVRLDTLVAYYKSLEYQNKYYNEESSISTPSFKQYGDTILRQLINAGGDYVLTALANYYAPEYFNLKPANYSLNLDDETSTVIRKLLILASFKEPILLDLKAAASLSDLSEEDRAILALAFVMLGDYNSAKTLYDGLESWDIYNLLAILATFIDKPNAVQRINAIIESEPEFDYLPFAIISFFMNNELNLKTKSTVKITVNNETEQFEITPLDIEKRIYYSNDLASLKFESNSDKLLATYYYQGAITELGETDNDIKIWLDGNRATGQNINLVIDISNLQGEERNGELNIALPSNLKFSATFSSESGLYLIRNNNEYVKLSLSETYSGNTIKIPLYVSNPGNYTFETVIFTHQDNYHLSNSFTFDI